MLNNPYDLYSTVSSPMRADKNGKSYGALIDISHVARYCTTAERTEVQD